jgi:ABC-type multidrug transport system fused ATPase/permease subunit
LIGAPEKEKYLIYGYLGMRDLKDLGYFSLINYACNLSVVAVFVVLLLRNFNLWGLLGFMPVLLLDSWINGKRNIVFLIVFFIIYLVFTNRRFSLLKKSIFTFVFVGFSVWFTSFYTSEIKKDVTGNTDKYTQYRIDFSRDHTLKLAIYSELHPERAPILDYRGETMLFYLTIFVPRNLWPDKPLTYAQYITAAGLSQKAGYIGWGLTSSIFDELVANFGLWILLLCPWIIFKMIRFGESAQNKFVSLFTIFIVGVFMTVEITAYYILVIGWILLVRKFAKENRLFMKKLKKYKKWQEEIYLTGPSQS